MKLLMEYLRLHGLDLFLTKVRPAPPPTPLTVQILSEPLQKLVSGRFNDSLKSGPAVGAWRACLKSQYSSTKLTRDSPGR